MNKKNLSVVMAGAMLATSVAPVLADTTTTEIKDKYEITSENAGKMIREIENLLASKKFYKYDKTATGELSSYADTSVYRIRIFNGTNGTTEVTSGAEDLNMLGGSKKVYKDTTELRKTLDAADAFTGTNSVKVEVYELGYTEKDGKVLSVGDTAASGQDVYNQSELNKFESYVTNGVSDTSGSLQEFEDAVTNKWITGIKKVNNQKYTIELASFKSGTLDHNTIDVNLGDKVLDFTKPLDAEGLEIPVPNTNKDDIASKIAGFAVKETAGSKDQDIALTNAKLLTTIEVTGATGSYTTTCDELYDGLMLTEKGHDLMNEAQAYYKDKTNNVQNANYAVSSDLTPSSETAGAVYTFDITMTNAAGKAKTVTVKGNNFDRMTALKAMFGNTTTAPCATVDIIAGDTRYETAVEIAKSYLIADNHYNGMGVAPTEIVLVNGEALVDGLAAAPYAKSKNAPILLTAEDSLPKVTRDYLIELLSKATLGGLKDIKVTVIGGESVVSENVIRELESIGLSTDRLAGKDREATSLAVAREMTVNNKGAFVVGANGEADAMSAASVAATDGMPIIVSSVHGLSEEAARQAKKSAGTGTVTIVGGESVVSKEEEELIKDFYNTAVKPVERVAGSNRQATNAAMIEKFAPATGMENVIVAKDGIKGKSELVDALPASVFASVKGAQIVLATDKLTEEQLNAVALNTSKSGKTLYQVGNGVEKSVISTLAERLGLSK